MIRAAERWRAICQESGVEECVTGFVGGSTVVKTKHSNSLESPTKQAPLLQSVHDFGLENEPVRNPLVEVMGGLVHDAREYAPEESG